MTDLKATHTARVRVTLEVNCSQPWDEEVQLKDLYKRALEEARDKILAMVDSSTNVKIVPGSDEVVAVMVPKQ